VVRALSWVLGQIFWAVSMVDCGNIKRFWGHICTYFKRTCFLYRTWPLTSIRIWFWGISLQSLDRTNVKGFFQDDNFEWLFATTLNLSYLTIVLQVWFEWYYLHFSQLLVIKYEAVPVYDICQNCTRVPSSKTLQYLLHSFQV
jgi:hypothetical protein